MGTDQGALSVYNVLVRIQDVLADLERLQSLHVAIYYASQMYCSYMGRICKVVSRLYRNRTDTTAVAHHAEKQRKRRNGYIDKQKTAFVVSVIGISHRCRSATRIVAAQRRLSPVPLQPHLQRP